MKAIYPKIRQVARLALGLLAFTAVSCGSYQNSSYYDNDGIYGTPIRPAENKPVAEESNSQGLQYKQYFGSLQNDDAVTFTDPDSYTSYDSTSQAQRTDAASYSSWGGNSETVTVNVYDNWGWGPGWGWGWNSWYGPGWGWGWGVGWNWGWGWNSWYGPYWGWSWNHPAWYNPYWGGGYYGNHYTYYGGGRRGIPYNSNLRANATRQNTGLRSASFGNRQSSFSGSRAVTPPRAQSTTPRSNNYNTPRNNNNSGVRQSTTPTRSYSPSPSYGGSRGGGNYGGSRGGGGRR